MASTNYMKTTREHFMRRLSGMSPEGQRKMTKAQENQQWRGTCRFCGTLVEGVMSVIRVGCPECNKEKLDV